MIISPRAIPFYSEISSLNSTETICKLADCYITQSIFLETYGVSCTFYSNSISNFFANNDKKNQHAFPIRNKNFRCFKLQNRHFSSSPLFFAPKFKYLQIKGKMKWNSRRNVICTHIPILPQSRFPISKTSRFPFPARWMC